MIRELGLVRQQLVPEVQAVTLVESVEIGLEEGTSSSGSSSLFESIIDRVMAETGNFGREGQQPQ